MIIHMSTIGKAHFHRLVCSMTQIGLGSTGYGLEMMQDDVGGVPSDAESTLGYNYYQYGFDNLLLLLGSRVEIDMFVSVVIYSTRILKYTVCYSFQHDTSSVVSIP